MHKRERRNKKKLWKWFAVVVLQLPCRHYWKLIVKIGRVYSYNTVPEVYLPVSLSLPGDLTLPAPAAFTDTLK